MLDISCVIPVFNRVEWVAETIQSLLTQSVPVQLVIVDDCSTDGTREFLKDWAEKQKNTKVIYNEVNKGGGLSRNVGNENADGKIIAVCDSDDIYDTDRAKHILEFFERNPKNVMLNAPYQQIGYNNEVIEEFEGMEFDEELFKKTGAVTYFSHPTAAYLKEDILEIGGYKAETKTMTDDYQLVGDWIRAGKKIGFDKRHVVCGHRVLPSSMMVGMRGFNPAWVGK